jgi:hypothetical protein
MARWPARSCYVALEHWLGGLWDYWHILLGGLLLMVVLFARGGIVGLLCGGRPAAWLSRFWKHAA